MTASIFSRTSLVILSGALAFHIGLGFLALAPYAIPFLPSSMKDGLVGIPILFGSDIGFLGVYFFIFAAIGAAIGLMLTGKRKTERERETPRQ